MKNFPPSLAEGLAPPGAMAPLEMNEGTTTVLGVGYNKLTNSCSAKDPAKRPLTFTTSKQLCLRKVLINKKKIHMWKIIYYKGGGGGEAYF
jgi:hypothetical protein